MQQLFEESNFKLEEVQKYLKQFDEKAQEKELKVTKETIFQDLTTELGKLVTAKDLLVKYKVEIDGGVAGVFTEYLQKSLESEKDMFVRCDDKGITYLPKEGEDIDVTKFFAFGRALLMSVMQKIAVNVRLPPSFYRYILGEENEERPLKNWMCDLEMYDHQYTMSLQKLLAIEDAKTLDYEFENEKGEKLKLDNDNREDYVLLAAKNKLFNSRKKAFDAIKNGFSIPEDEGEDVVILQELKKNLTVFTPTELMMLMCQDEKITAEMIIKEIDFLDWGKEDKTPEFFKKFLTSMEVQPISLRRFLKYISGMAAIPVGGFSKKLRIIKREGDTMSAHSCFNYIDCPEFGDYETFSEALFNEVKNICD
ncbi:hect domain ubiquitin-protein ligase [Anaeramoeba ignava]|uniref:HECT-type E3 ubiquitin transferase n=1 Tax=Anaeramoeba ignava TaxID=1746090 RepID=A0A9Q0LFS3_ANAIG|nr:hect domain ubiquitin-protein ligase [Anaeramoeba ignava]|eukprot:Anaeramoba_ignava/a478633_1088.p1 GENE.a478633_1088~~a478633_1088.p1  ORF type:complete len:366 (-),score=100.71 a478633_1088:287-1384(-)